MPRIDPNREEWIAIAKGLLANPNWSKYPADMLLARATSRLCRVIYADLVASWINDSPEQDPAGDPASLGPVTDPEMIAREDRDR